jgi:hypothetical protein
MTTRLTDPTGDEITAWDRRSRFETGHQEFITEPLQKDDTQEF